MMVCRVVAYRSLSIALGLAPTPSTRKRRDLSWITPFLWI